MTAPTPNLGILNQLTDWLNDWGTWPLRTLKAFENSSTWGTRVLKGLKSTWTLGHLDTQGTWALGHLGIWALIHLGNQGTRGTLFSRLNKRIYLNREKIQLRKDHSKRKERTLGRIKQKNKEWNRSIRKQIPEETRNTIQYFVKISLSKRRAKRKEKVKQ